MTSVSDIPTAYTPPGGYGAEMPEPFLDGCTEPIPEGAPDLHGMWRAVDVRAGDEVLPPEHPIWQHRERIEQRGNRVIVTSSGLVHDMIVDGTYENGVNDVAAVDFATPIHVAAFYEDGALVLRPKGMPGVEVRRWRDGEHLMWQYHTMFTARLARD
jgi:hypothetical protein